MTSAARERRLRVLVVTNMYPSPHAPGYGTFVHDQVVALLEAGLDVDVLAIDGRASRWAYAAAVPRLWRRLARGRYDVIHAHHPLAGVVARAQWGRPVVLTQHGLIATRDSPWQRLVSRFLKPLVDERVYVGEHVRAALGDEHEGWVIPCGVDLARFVPAARDAARARLELAGDRRSVLFAADPARPEKRFALAGRAVELARAELPDLELLVANGRPHEEMPALMAGCDALLLTSSSEGSPMVVKEALACGLGVVSTPVGDVPGLIDGLSGCCLADPDPEALAGALVAVLRETDRYDAAAGRARVHDLRESARRLHEVYLHALSPPRPAGRPTVCIVKHGYFPDSHVRRNAEALVAEGFEVHVVCLRRPSQPARETVSGIHVHRQPVHRVRGSAARYAVQYGAFTALACLAVARIHVRRRLALVEIDNMPDLLVLAAVAPRLTGARVVHYVMDTMPELYMELSRVGPRHPVVRALALVERLATSLADRVIVTQELPRRMLTARGVSPDKLAVVLNTADEGVFARRQRRHRRASRTRPFRVVTHGSVLERYGIQVLCDAVPALSATLPGVEVDVYGDGEQLERLAERARDRGVSDRFRLHGFVPQRRLLAALEDADAGYVGMLNNLSLPNKLMEFVALGIPAVVARWPVFEQYFPDSAVTYFRPGDPADLARALREVHDDPESARVRAAEARALFDAAYAWRIQRERYLEVYGGLLNGRVGTSAKWAVKDSNLRPWD